MDNIITGDVDRHYEDAAPIKAYITNLGRYNEGELLGKWVSFPTDYETIKQVFKDIGIDGIRYEEFFITDYETEISSIYDMLGEYESLDELNYLAATLDEMEPYAIPLYESALEYEGARSIKDAINLVYDLDNYHLESDVSTEQELGEWLVEDGMVNVPQDFRYIDYEALGRDWALEADCCFTKNGYLERIDSCSCGIYDGKEVPEGYRVLSKPVELDISPDKLPRKPEHER